MLVTYSLLAHEAINTCLPTARLLTNRLPAPDCAFVKMERLKSESFLDKLEKAKQIESSVEVVLH